MITNRSMPPGTIIPELAYEDVHAAARWLCKAFGFCERLRIPNHRIQLTLGDASIVVIELPSGQRSSPGLGTHRVMVHVTDVHAHHARAKAAGAQVTNPPTDYPFGERQYSALDVGGHRWTFSESIADIDPSTWGGELLTQ
jgi:uncharacterized glyoxalase superfamily protein PhnB